MRVLFRAPLCEQKVETKLRCLRQQGVGSSACLYFSHVLVAACVTRLRSCVWKLKHVSLLPFQTRRFTWTFPAGWTCRCRCRWWLEPSLFPLAPAAPPASAATAAPWAGWACRRDLRVWTGNASRHVFSPQRLWNKMISYSGLFIAAPPSYSDLAISEAHRRDCLQGCDRSDGEGEDQGSLLTYITEFKYLPPPLSSEVHSTHTHTESVTVQMCPDRWKKTTQQMKLLFKY